MEHVKWRDIARYIWSHWRLVPVKLAIVAASLLLMTGAEILLPLFSGKLVDVLSQGPMSSHNAATEIVWALFAIGLIYAIARFVMDRVWLLVATTTMRKMVQDAFHRIQRFSTEWHNNAFAGATVRKVTRGQWAYDTMADVIVYGFIPSLLVVGGVIVLIAARLPLIALFLASMVLIYIGLNILAVTKYISHVNRLSNEQDSKVGAALADSITCNTVVKSFGAEVREDELFSDTISLWRERANVAWSRMTNTGFAQLLVLNIVRAGMLFMSLWFWSNGTATTGDVVLVLTSYFIIHGYLREIGHDIRMWQKGVNEIEDIVKFSSMQFGVADAEGALDFKPKDGEISFEDITFGYENQNRSIYSDFSISIAAGERVALIGKSGSGKSTFVKLVQRLYDPDSGTVTIDGENIADVTQSSLRSAIALVAQDPILFHRTLAENISYGRPDASMEEITLAAKRAHADEFIDALPKDYDTLVGERGVKLSGGERQRVAIARAFLADCPILILDEATSSLDSHTEQQIQSSIKELMVGRTTIVIAHRLSTIREVDRILVFDAGEIVEQGNHDELMAKDEGYYRTMILSQAMGDIIYDEIDEEQEKQVS